MKMNEEVFRQDMFQYVDRIKDLLSMEVWQNVLLDCSKNEIFVLWLLYRKKEVNMTQIAEYIHVPLNTATGIISRMEKRDLVSRERSRDDKRIVTIRLGLNGEEQIQVMMKEFMFYSRKMIEVFSAEEMELFFRIMNKLEEIMKEERNTGKEKKKVKKILIE
ncbi:MarR family winged helix-turn-helix transcriptional regulator [Anaerosacchariphilus polymeriproducens]|uniref:MarR family transcriptional regulator n=1 Tax=Anaerosacchariphilus polymeriproducens TaxID=1812858 RepID=A0A371ARA0_9FIRM|nr:MarR family transcriptional regulator [Anaerosacchariphilus polymeriproducens]RDU21960.1 MarR family transcriptional regulator [Anaerosacchariphilus polymeriproducens]